MSTDYSYLQFRSSNLNLNPFSYLPGISRRRSKKPYIDNNAMSVQPNWDLNWDNNNKINNNKNTTKIYQEGVYNKSGIWNKTLTHKIKIK